MLQAASLCPEAELRVPVDLLTPASVAEASRRHAASSFSPLSAASLAAQEPGPGSLGWQLASSAVSRVRRWSQASAARPGLASLCCTCARILAQVPRYNRAANEPSAKFSQSQTTEKASTRAFSWLKAPTSTFMFKSLYAKC